MTHVLFSISGTIAKITNFSSENSTPHVQLSIPEERQRRNHNGLAQRPGLGQYGRKRI